jgi:gamma-glutamylcyclotransferase (GGCT)/AIG2-like uncharacterized protein YtfP
MRKRIKSAILAAILLAISCMMSACTVTIPTAEEVTEETTATSGATTAAAVVATAEVTTTTAAETTTAETEEESGENVVSIGIFEQSYSEYANIEVLELFSWGDETPGMIEGNDAIKADVIARIDAFAENFDETVGNGINVYAYPFSDENYLQIIHTVLEYPTYGNAGEVFGVVYDIANDDVITLDEFLASYEVTEDEMTDVLMDLYLEANPENSVDAVTLKTFKLTKDADGEYYPSILFEMEVTGPEADEPYKGFYIYSDIDSEVWEMNSEQLFDPYDVDVDGYEDLLHCHEGWYEYHSGDEGYDYSGDPEENTLDILWDRLGDLTTDKMLVYTGEEEINGELCDLYALGTDSPEKFTAEMHFAISTETYEIYYMDILEGPDWIPYD